MAIALEAPECCRNRRCNEEVSTSSECPDWFERAVDQPILLQVGNLGKRYKAWVHKPVKGRPRFFQSSVLESVTKTPWWVVPTLWIPVILCCLVYSLATSPLEASQILGLTALGVLVWQLIEYAIHRWVFHLIPDNYWGITAHFLFHGCHHKYPMDSSRLVFPPLPAAAVALAIYGALQITVPQAAVLPIFTGIIWGYLAYDCLHYGMHHGGAKGWLGPLRQAHLHHHYRAPDAGFGISSPLFDVLLHSQPPLVTRG